MASLLKVCIKLLKYKTQTPRTTMAGSFLTVGRLFSRMYTQGASSDVSIVPERDYCIAFNHGWKSAQNLIAEV